jgi:hypothetical protein
MTADPVREALERALPYVEAEARTADGYAARETAAEVASAARSALASTEASQDQGGCRRTSHNARRCYVHGRDWNLCDGPLPLTATEAPGWQDIATAPKDGTAILGGRGGENPWGVPDIVLWLDGSGAVSDGPGWYRFAGVGWNTRTVRPTHWMPLPSPPKERA